MKPGAARPTYYDNRRGIFAVVLSCALFTVNDMLMKSTTLLYPASEILFIRGLGTILCAGVVLAYTNQKGWVAATTNLFVLLRAGMEASAHVCFIIAISRMRLAELLALNLVSPLLLTIILGFFFKEPVSWSRWLAVFVGLGGTLFIVKPSPSAFNFWALIALGGATASALREVATRRIHGDVPTMAISFSSLVAVTLAGVVLAVFLGDRWVPLSGNYLSYVLAAAVFLSVGSYFAVSAFRNVDLTVVAPFRYTLLIWGALGGYLVFNEVPDTWSVLGILLVVGSGVYIVHRERARHRAILAAW